MTHFAHTPPPHSFPTPPKRTPAVLKLLAAAVVVALVAGGGWWFFKHRDSNVGIIPSLSESSDVASANDTGPVTLITEDPTCIEFKAFTIDVGTKLDAEFNQIKDTSIPASSWSPETRKAYESAKVAFTEYADRAVGLSKKTPHRAMRELYGQMAAYYRAFVGEIDGYTPDDRKLLEVANSIYKSLDGICIAASNGSAAEFAAQIPPADPPTTVAPLGNIDDPQRFITTGLEMCPMWFARGQRVDQKLALFLSLTGIPAKAEWDSMSKRAMDDAALESSRSIYEVKKVGRSTGNPVAEDILVLSSRYHAAFVYSMLDYKPADMMLYESATWLGKIMWSGCNLVKG